MLDLAFIALLTIWSAGAGMAILCALGTRLEHPAQTCGLAIPLGLGTLALAAAGLGELGALSRGGLIGVLAVGGFFAIRTLRVWFRETRWQVTMPRSMTSWIVLSCLVVTLSGTLLTALAPVTEGDALCYHLQVPKIFLARHGLCFEPDLHETVYPLLTELLYAVALAFRGPVACRLIQWVLGVTIAINVASLARPVLGSRAWWAGAVALLVPGVSNGMGAALNDVALAAFGNAALVALMHWRDEPSGRSTALVGVLTGLALGVKYPALVLAGLVGLTYLLCTLVTRLKAARQAVPGTAGPPRFAHVLLLVLLAVLVGGGWYLRAYLYTGNPVYPFFRHTFGGAGFDAVLDPHKKAVPVHWFSLLTALGPMTLQPGRFESVSHQLGPAFLLFLPGLLLVRVPRRVGLLAAIGFAFLVLCLSQRQSMRFVLTAFGPLAVAVAWVASRWQDRRGAPGRILVSLLLFIMGFEATIALARARHGLGVVLGRETAEEYLTRREPTYRVARWAGEHLPSDARLIGQEHRGFYFPRDYTMELAHRRRTGLGNHGEPADTVIAALRAEGFTHLLLCPPVPESAVEFDPTLSRRLAPWLASRVPLYQEDIIDPDGVFRRYAIFALVDAPPAEPLSSTSAGRARR